MHLLEFKSKRPVRADSRFGRQGEENAVYSHTSQANFAEPRRSEPRYLLDEILGPSRII